MEENNSNDVRIDFRDLAEDFSSLAEDLQSPEFQPDHPSMTALKDTLYYNFLGDDGRRRYDEHATNTGKFLPLKDVYEAMEEVTNGKVDREKLQEQFYSGLMDDIRYSLYQKMKQENPDITAQQYFENFVQRYEPRSVQKMAKAFQALMKEPLRSSKRNTYFTREQVQRMTTDEVRKNLPAIEESRKHWK